MAGYHSDEVRDKCLAALATGNFSLSQISKHYGPSRQTIKRWANGGTTRQNNTFLENYNNRKEIIPTYDPTRGIDIAVIADMQVKPNIDLGYCSRIGRYLSEEKPDVIVNIGDFADMPSCSFHEEPGSKAFAAQNYKSDILSVHMGMKALMTPIKNEMERTGWNPRLVFCLGNHEERINRTLSAIPKLDGTIGLPDLEYERWGWEVHAFLKPVEIAGVIFSHYFPSGQMGRPISSARAMVNKLHMSAVGGHQQGRDLAFGKRADGRQITCLYAGSAYEHDEDYLNPQTNNHWRGFYMLNDCIEGEFEEKAVSMKYLRRKYGC